MVFRYRFCFLYSFIHPGKMLLGSITMVVVLAVFAYLSTRGRAIHDFKKRYPAAGIVAILLGSCFLTYTLGSLLVFLIGVLLPFSGKALYLFCNIDTKVMRLRSIGIIDNLFFLWLCSFLAGDEEKVNQNVSHEQPLFISYKWIFVCCINHILM